MNVEQMTDEEKSVMLARLIGWTKEHGDDFWIDDNGMSVWGWTQDIGQINFYLEGNMSIAWRVLNWAMQQEAPLEDTEPFAYTFSEAAYDRIFDNGRAHEEKPADAQRIILDEILSLAIKAGLVEETK